MKPVLAAALLAATLSPAVAQTASGVSPAYSVPGVYHTGPRYCPELADTGHPFAAVCPSDGQERDRLRSDAQISPVGHTETEEVTTPIRSNGRWHAQ